jgi:hypothetical protein
MNIPEAGTPGGVTGSLGDRAVPIQGVMGLRLGGWPLARKRPGGAQNTPGARPEPLELPTWIRLRRQARPDGPPSDPSHPDESSHLADCRCPNCVWNVGRPEPITDPVERTALYAEKIHWWVRLFGVVWLTTLAIGVVFGIFVGVHVAADRNTAGTSLAKYQACIVNGYSAAYCLKNN